jgi:RNA polymerase sigma-70 factor (ECF subfamily)
MDGDRAQDEDFRLMALAAEGSQEAFAALVERHQRPLLNFFMRMGASTHAEDLAQETFVRLWKYREKYKPEARFTTFLYTLARHAWLDSARSRRRFALFTARYQEEMPAFTDGGIGEMRKGLDIRAALDHLPPRLREVLVLAVLQQLPYGEIAEILEIPVGTVKSRVFTALQMLKESFHDEV